MIPDSEDAKVAITVCSEYVHMITDYGFSHNLAEKYPRFEDEVNFYMQECESLQQRLQAAEDGDLFEEYSKLAEFAFILKQSLNKSYILDCYKDHRAKQDLRTRLTGEQLEASLSRNQFGRRLIAQHEVILERMNQERDRDRFEWEQEKAQIMLEHAIKLRQLEACMLRESDFG